MGYDTALDDEEQLALQQQQEDDPPDVTPQVPAEPQVPEGGVLPVSPTPNIPTTPDEILRSRFSALAHAQDTANQNRFYARLGQAASNLGTSIARGTPQNQDVWNEMANSAEQPVKDTEKLESLSQGKDKLLRDWALKQAAVAGKAKASTDWQNLKKEEGQKNRDSRIEMAHILANSRTAGLPVRIDKASASAANDIHNDPSLSQAKKRYQSIARGMHNVSDTMNLSTAHEVLQDFAAALSGQNSSSNYKIQSISPETLQEWLNKKEIWATSNPNMPAPKGLVDFLKQQGPRLKASFQSSIKSEARAKSQGKNYTTPQLKQAVDDAKNYYLNGDYFDDTDKEFGSASTKPATNKPPVTQNGHTYNWNPETGKYE